MAEKKYQKISTPLIINMNKKIFSVVLFLIFTFNALLAQPEPKQDAADMLWKTVQRYNVLQSFSIDFTLKFENNVVKLPIIKGVLLVKKEKYHLSFGDQIVANDGKMVWNFQKESNEISLFATEDDEFSIFQPLKMLNNWDKDYNAKLIRKEENQKKMDIIIDLTPKIQSSFYKTRLFIDEATYYIQKILMYDIDGTITTYSITKFLSNIEIDERKFIFNKTDFPNVQINDMR